MSCISKRLCVWKEQGNKGVSEGGRIKRRREGGGREGEGVKEGRREGGGETEVYISVQVPCSAKVGDKVSIPIHASLS